MSRESASVIDLPNFIQATRDSGYRSTANAIAELVDNALEAGATRVLVDIAMNESSACGLPVVQVADDGAGMSQKMLREALRFGGSSRFGARKGLGRFGMGLPNASLSQSKRVEVTSWTSSRSCWFSYLDVGQIAAGRMADVPIPTRVPLPQVAASLEAETGTVVRWTDCDRLENRRVSTIERKVSNALGRIFRHFIWQGVRISVNGTSVPGLDPLHLHPKSPSIGADRFGETLEFRVRASPTSRDEGIVRVVFSELPVEKWATLSTVEKRSRGISNGAGVSIVRGGREIDYGWFFMGGKRRENYDDWWRCELQFEPVLDDAFGITHTKQEIRPADHLLEALGAELEETAKALNARARSRYAKLKAAATAAPVELRLERQNEKLPALPKRETSATDRELLRRLVPKRVECPQQGSPVGVQFRLVEEDRAESAFFRTVSDGDAVVVVLNSKHAFCRDFYRRLTDGIAPAAEDTLQIIQALLLSAGRAEAMVKRPQAMQVVEEFRQQWGKALSLLIAR